MSSRKKWWLAGVTLAVILIISIVVWQMDRRHNIIIGGGLCHYDSTHIGAKVLTMPTNKADTASDSFSVTVEVVTKDRGADTIDLSRIYPYRRYTQKKWALSGLKPGDVIKCTYFTEVEGTCAPYSYHFLLEKYY